MARYKEEAETMRVVLILALLALSACGNKYVPEEFQGKQNISAYTAPSPQELALAATATSEDVSYFSVPELEARNADRVEKAATGCGLRPYVFDLGAHGWEFPEDVAETSAGDSLQGADACMARRLGGEPPAS